MTPLYNIFLYHLESVFTYTGISRGPRLSIDYLAYTCILTPHWITSNEPTFFIELSCRYYIKINRCIVIDENHLIFHFLSE
uniref:Uncharacterized protein n=1 Tax=Populus trichocarpa TaxID=3694 RepID=A0A2K1Y5J9_POPTR